MKFIKKYINFNDYEEEKNVSQLIYSQLIGWYINIYDYGVFLSKVKKNIHNPNNPLTILIYTSFKRTLTYSYTDKFSISNDNIKIEKYGFFVKDSNDYYFLIKKQKKLLVDDFRNNDFMLSIISTYKNINTNNNDELSTSSLIRKYKYLYTID
jgi:hypothetical protein